MRKTTTHFFSTNTFAATAMSLFVLVMPLTMLAAVPSDIQTQINDLQTQVNQKKQSLQELDQKIKQYQALVTQKRSTAISLEGEVNLLDNRLKKTQLDIDITKDQIKKVQLEISLLDNSIVYRENQIEKDKAVLASLTRSLYGKEYRRSALDILASYDSFSDFYVEVNSLLQLQDAVKTTLGSVKKSRNQLQVQQQDRQQKGEELADQTKKLQTALNDLQDQRVAKQGLLAQTRSSELQYRYLLEGLKKEQDDADAEISRLEKALRAKSSVSQQILNDQQATLSWPVSPTRGISTQFRDPDYPFRYVFEHPGIDIRARQSTPVRAAASGVVARAKDAGMGYSYVMVLHANTISTVYGHISKVVAREGSYVERGDIIGYSGGLPGTPGAGKLTTGPHLHFEVRSNGIPVNPLNYLSSL